MSEGTEMTGKSMKYAIVTLELKFGLDEEFTAAVTAVLPIIGSKGIRLVRSWTPIIGQYRKVVSIWEAASHAAFLEAFSDPLLACHAERLEALGTVTLELATALVEVPRNLQQESRKGGIIGTGTITIQPGKAKEFARIVADAVPQMERHGLSFYGSYQIQVGNRSRVLDVFWAPSASAVYEATSDPYWATQIVDLDWPGTLVSETVEVSTEIVFD